ncbi:unannotated protein [freshwater metagenome]|uniref:Unannotated protein n=1 Tax=freshwater metagenome TaxID=449393 RepID=A0A6J6T7P1_9ZZZZ
MAIRTDAEQDDVETGSATVILRPSVREQMLGIVASRRLSAHRPIGPLDRMYARGVDCDVIEERSTRRGFIAIRITGGQIPLISPPELDPRPVDGIARRRERQCGEHRGADASSGEDDSGNASIRLPLDDAGCEDPCS